MVSIGHACVTVCARTLGEAEGWHVRVGEEHLHTAGTGRVLLRPGCFVVCAHPNSHPAAHLACYGVVDLCQTLGQHLQLQMKGERSVHWVPSANAWACMRQLQSCMAAVGTDPSGPLTSA